MTLKFMLVIGILCCINLSVLSSIPADLVSDDWEKLDGVYEWIKTGCGKAGSDTMGKPDQTYLPFNVRDGKLRCGWWMGKYAKAEWAKKDETDCNKKGSAINLRIFDSTTKCTGMPSDVKSYSWGVDDPSAGTKRNVCVDGTSTDGSVYVSCAKPATKTTTTTTTKPAVDGATETTFKASLAFVVLICSYIML